MELRPRNPPGVVSAALVLPAGLLSPEVARHARETQAVERRAVDAVLAAEWALGLSRRRPPNNKGYDVVSRRAGEPDVHIEVKGRISGADSVTVTYSELIHGKNLGSSTGWRWSRSARTVRRSTGCGMSATPSPATPSCLGVAGGGGGVEVGADVGAGAGAVLRPRGGAHTTRCVP